MNITWLGHSCFKIEEKVNNDNIVVITDPFDKSTGLRLPKLKADIVTVSHYHVDHCNYQEISGSIKSTPLLIDRPGEYECLGISVNGVGSYHDQSEGAERGKSVMFRFEINGLSVLHLGDIGTILSDQQLNKIGEIDILFVPVGGKYTVGAKEAAEIVRQIEPRIVIPMHYKIPELIIDVETADKFCKEMGNGAEKLQKLKINKKDLPADEIKLIILDRV